MPTTKTPITEEALIAMGFKQTSPNQYRLSIDLPYLGSREIIANTNSTGWFCYYWVNGVAASGNKHSMEEVQELFEAVGK